MQDCAKKIVSNDVGLGHCLGAVALVGSRRRQNPTDVQGWRGAQQSIAATASGLPPQVCPPLLAL